MIGKSRVNFLEPGNPIADFRLKCEDGVTVSSPYQIVFF